MKSLTEIFKNLFNNDRRKSGRLPSPKLSAYYWPNSAASGYSIRDISSTGLFLLTEERWYPGTLVMVTLQKKDGGPGRPDSTIAVQTRAVRWGSDGVGLEFICPEPRTKGPAKSLFETGADRKTLDKFLEGFEADGGQALVGRVEEM